MPKKKRKSQKSKSFDKKTLMNNILGIFSNNPSKTFNYKQLAITLGIKDIAQKQLITEVLYEFVDVGSLEEVYRGKFKLKSKRGYLTGKLDLTTKGYGYLVSDEMEQDTFVSQANLNHALHGDTVKVYLYAQRKKHQPEGEVVEILERARTTFVGTIEKSGKFAFLITDSSRMPFDLFIPLEQLNGAEDGQKAVAKITDWPKRAKNPFGEVVQVLGNPGENDTEMHSILAEYELPYDFPDKVDQAADKIPAEITQADVEARRDFRDITTFTIDPVDAKDFDDALSLRKLKNGNWEVGVHIADVTHYVTMGSILEDEALERATSVYLVDRVVPMLPERLSNMICSLRPNEEKLCYSAVFELDEDANIIQKWFGRTIINSDRRFTYEEAQNIIETGDGDFSSEVLTLHNLAQKIRHQRYKEGSINFERVEVKFHLDEKGKPLGVFYKESKEANKLIEEFMLLANKKVAEIIGKVSGNSKAKTFVYRIHDKPDVEKLEKFSQFIHKFGYSIKTGSNKAIASSLNQLLTDIEGTKEQDIIENLAIRSMAKAEYSTGNVGHYGLSFDHYTHFTSPIRRYPDMMVHRLLDAYLKGESSKSKQKYEKMCQHSSEKERKAAEAERASIKYKQVEFMSDKIGEHFEGVISGVTEWGIYVEIIENKCEGMVPLRELEGDFYVFDEDNYCITGKKSKIKYQLGDNVTIEIVRANMAKKQLDFKMIRKESHEE